MPGLKKDEIRVRLADANRRLILEGETKTFDKTEAGVSASTVDATVEDEAAGSTAASGSAGDTQGA